MVAPVAVLARGHLRQLEEHGADHHQAEAHAGRADEQQGLAAEAVDPGHGDEGGDHVDGADGPQGGQALAGRAR